MEKLKRISSILWISIVLILLGFSISQAAAEDNLSTEKIYNWVTKNDETFVNLDGKKLIETYYRNKKIIHNIYEGGSQPSDKAKTFMRYWRCIQSYATNPAGSYGFNIKNVIDFTNSGTTIYYYSNKNKKVEEVQIKNETNVKKFKNLGWALEKDLKSENLNQSYGANYYWANKAILQNAHTYYPVSGNSGEYAGDVNDLPDEIKGDNVVESGVEEGYKLRLLITTMEVEGNNGFGQSRMFFGRAKTDDDGPDTGSIFIEKISSLTGKPMKGVVFTVQNGKNHYYNKKTKKFEKFDGTDIPEKYKIETNENGTYEIKDLPKAKYKVTEIEVKNNAIGQPNYGYIASGETKTRTIKAIGSGQNAENKAVFKYENDYQLGKLALKKVDKDTNQPMGNVGFTLQMTSGEKAGQYVGIDSKGDAIYSSTVATIYTDSVTGIREINNLWKGTYKLIETINPYYGYEKLPKVIDGNLVIDGNNQVRKVIATNKRTYIKLSGYVWVDKIDKSKQSQRNDLYKDGDYDSEDILLDGITVRLKDRTTGETVKQATTSQLNRYKDAGNNGHGEYLFEDVLIEKLGDYYIEFEYDGLTYQNVIPHIDKNNGSKAAERSREEFNQQFSTIEGEGREKGYTKNAQGDKKFDLSYNINEQEHTATLINKGQYTITSDTDVPAFSIQSKYTGQGEIKYINLGLQEREKPDIALVKDIQNVKVEVNGYGHIYNYDRRFQNAGEYGDGFNVGVKFGQKYGNMEYGRAIYKSDYLYKNETDKSRELKVYITYKITMKNQSSNLIAKVNSIADYYDSKYEITGITTNLDELEKLPYEGTIRGNLATSAKESEYNSKYKKVVINNNTTIGSEKQESIYVQFKLDKEQVVSILDGKNEGEKADNGNLLDNVAEINSYSIYDKENKPYAGIDIDSNPGNCIPGEKNTYEDDTDSSPALRLEVAEARKMTGTVFEDETDKKLKTGETRQGDGTYQKKEKTISGVTVKLQDKDGNTAKILEGDGWKEAETTTNEYGSFEIKNYIPGEYKIVYTWGDETYPVQNYKGTIYTKERWDKNKENLTWYKDEVETRYTDAIDNYETRTKIDDEMKTVNEADIKITKMDSITPNMKINVEYEPETASAEDRYTYEIKNIDFGIVERARQQLDITKDVTGVKITLANGQTIINATIDDNGKLQGETKGLTYMGPANGNNGTVKAEIDNELIQGATIEIKYTIKVTNNGEKDYHSEDYYKYGIPDESKIIKMKPNVYDYLDSQMVLKTESTGWEIIEESRYENEMNKQTIIERYFSEKEKDGIYQWETADKVTQELLVEWGRTQTQQRKAKLNNKTILHNEKLEQELEPGKSNSADLVTSKVLANTDEIDLNNDTEITEITRIGETGRIPEIKTSQVYDRGETVTVTPPTGENQNYTLPIIVGITALAILGAGIIVIKKKDN